MFIIFLIPNPYIIAPISKNSPSRPIHPFISLAAFPLIIHTPSPNQNKANQLFAFLFLLFYLFIILLLIFLSI